MKDTKQLVLEVSAQTGKVIRDISILIDSNGDTLWRP